MPGKRVLVVERDDGVRMTIQHMLELHEHEVVAVKWPNAAFEPLAKKAFDIAFIGRGGSCFQDVHVLAWVVRSMHADIAMILMTGQGMTGDAPEPFETVLFKPFSIDQIQQLVERHCPDRQAEPDIERVPGRSERDPIQAL